MEAVKRRKRDTSQLSHWQSGKKHCHTRTVSQHHLLYINRVSTNLPCSVQISTNEITHSGYINHNISFFARPLGNKISSVQLNLKKKKSSASLFSPQPQHAACSCHYSRLKLSSWLEQHDDRCPCLCFDQLTTISKHRWTLRDLCLKKAWENVSFHFINKKSWSQQWRCFTQSEGLDTAESLKRKEEVLVEVRLRSHEYTVPTGSCVSVQLYKKWQIKKVLDFSTIISLSMDLLPST